MVGSKGGLEDGEGEWSSKGLHLDPYADHSPSPWSSKGGLEDGEGEWSAVRVD